MAYRRLLSDKQLQNILENDSASDSDDDIGGIVPSPSNTYLELSDNDIIEQRLEQLIEDRLENDYEPIVSQVRNELVMDAAGLSIAIASGEASEITSNNMPDNDNIISYTNQLESDNVNDTVSNLRTASLLNKTYDRPERNYQDWKIQRNTHFVPQFTSKFCPKITYSHKSQPIDFFTNIFPDELINTILTETNRYAIQQNSKNFQTTTPQEIKAFLGVMIMMGLHPLPDYELYWSTDRFYNNPDISSAFTLSRFKKILENLHVNDNTTATPRNSANFDKLHKLRPLIDGLNVIFSQQAEESGIYSIDECMVKFKGRSTMRQYMPLKPIKRGYKVWARCDARTGYLYAFEVYTGKSETADEVGLGYTVVTNLCKHVPENSLVVFDNFFTSCKLIDVLHQNKIYAIGTVRKTRKGLPSFMKEKPQSKREKLAKHEFCAQTSEPILAVKWLDTKEVTVLSSAHNESNVTTVKRTQKDGTRKEVFCPKAIADYTLYMGGVDHFDHFRSSYPTGRKSRKFWMRLFFFMLDAAIINAYILYLTKHAQRDFSHRDFRLRLARALIGDFTCKKQRPIIFKNKKGGNFGVPDEIRLQSVGIHFPELQDTYTRCKFCSSKKETKRSNMRCSHCGVALCMKQCFKKFHMAVNDAN